ncbi:MAG: hypothetical protein KF906_05075 [Actinobacteria bacterium]|nr:hypothetical protein [Actinomycetota bacterium]
MSVHDEVDVRSTHVGVRLTVSELQALMHWYGQEADDDGPYPTVHLLLSSAGAPSAEIQAAAASSLAIRGLVAIEADRSIVMHPALPATAELVAGADTSVVVRVGDDRIARVLSGPVGPVIVRRLPAGYELVVDTALPGLLASVAHVVSALPDGDGPLLLDLEISGARPVESEPVVWDQTGDVDGLAAVLASRWDADLAGARR